MKSHHTIVILNPRAAAGRAESQWPKAERALRESVDDFAVLRTEYPGHATDLVRGALQNGSQRVISVGGDGTHHEVVNGFFDGTSIINRDAVLAILPIGTGSDLGRSLDLPRGVGAVPLIARNHSIRADVGRVTYQGHDGREHLSHFINVADFGAGGAVAERVNKGSKRLGGFVSFLSAVVRTLLSYRAPTLELDIDGERCVQKALAVIVANAEYYGGGIHVAREARIDDGKLDVFVVQDISFMTAVCNLRRMYRGDILDRPNLVRPFVVERVTLTSPDRVLINLDGEQPGILPATVEIVPGAFRLVTGRNV